jgi:hypothetical protein
MQLGVMPSSLSGAGSLIAGLLPGQGSPDGPADQRDRTAAAGVTSVAGHQGFEVERLRVHGYGTSAGPEMRKLG